MSDPVRFYFDQHLPNLAVNALPRRGVDVLTAHEAGTCGRNPSRLAGELLTLHGAMTAAEMLNHVEYL